jgi:hypothetical protein
MLLQALDIYEKEKGANAPEVGTVLNRLGVLYTNTGQLAKARQTLERAHQICETAYGVLQSHPFSFKSKQSSDFLVYGIEGRSFNDS